MKEILAQGQLRHQALELGLLLGLNVTLWVMWSPLRAIRRLFFQNLVWFFHNTSHEIPQPLVATHTAKLSCYSQYFIFDPTSHLFDSAPEECWIFFVVNIPNIPEYCIEVLEWGDKDLKSPYLLELLHSYEKGKPPIPSDFFTSSSQYLLPDPRMLDWTPFDQLE